MLPSYVGGSLLDCLSSFNIIIHLENECMLHLLTAWNDLQGSVRKISFNILFLCKSNLFLEVCMLWYPLNSLVSPNSTLLYRRKDCLTSERGIIVAFFT